MEAIEIIMKALPYEQRAQLITNLIELLQSEQESANYWKTECQYARNTPAVDVTPLNNRIEVLTQDVAYWKQVAAERLTTINQAALARGKEQCALGIINRCQEYHKAMLDALFADTPDYKAAWSSAPWQLLEAVSAIDPTQKIERIKVVRSWLPGLGLKEAKDFVEMHWQYDKQYGRTSE